MPILFTCALIVFVCLWILNPLTIAAILRSHAIRTSYSNIFILNLAVADLFLITMAVALTFPQISDNYENSSRFCIVKIIVFGTLVVGSILSSFAIAVDRFLYIAKPLRYPAIVTRSRVLGSLVVIWVLSLVQSFLPFYRETGFQGSSCYNPTKTDIRMIISMAITATVFIVLQVISTSMYIKMFRIIQKHHKLVESLSLSKMRSVSSVKNKRPLKSASRYGASALKSSDNHQNSPSPDFGLESNNVSSISQYDLDTEQDIDSLNPADVIGSDQAVMQQADITHRDDRQNVISQTKDSLLNYSDSGANSRVASFRNENENDGDPDTDIKVKAVYHIPFSIRMKKFTSSPQSSSPREEKQSTLGVSGGKKFKRRKCKYSLRDFRTIKTLMLMGNVHFLCWSPFITIKTLQHCFSMNIDAGITHGAAILGILNSILNFIVYPLRKAELRNTFKAMLLPIKKRFLRILDLCQN